MLKTLTSLTRRSTAEREAAAIRRATDAEVRAANLEGVLVSLLDDLDMMPTHVTVSSGQLSRAPKGYDLAVQVPFPPQLQVTLDKARRLTGGHRG